MRKFSDFLARLFLKCTGYTYSNLGRLFLRLFAGIMFLQFGIRHLVNYHLLSIDFPTVMGWSSPTCLNLMIIIELVCSLMIMIGFLTRLSAIPPILSMVAAEWYILHDLLPASYTYAIDSIQPGYLPIMFIGIFLFIIIAGPGKISVDYFITLYLLGRRGDPAENEEEILHDA
ncbi:MAG: DoxX family protein [Pseudoflavonifractor sp.]|nr:DoxX family protein [Alloprevotella sp.]MCM1116498.1 DoxX family protein [Pseudoflavonifractor sp.]